MRTASRVNPCTLSKRAVYIIRVDDLSLSPTNITRFAFASHRSTVHPLHPSPPLPTRGCRAVVPPSSGKTLEKDWTNFIGAQAAPSLPSPHPSTPPDRPDPRPCAQSYGRHNGGETPVSFSTWEKYEVSRGEPFTIRKGRGERTINAKRCCCRKLLIRPRGLSTRYSRCNAIKEINIAIRNTAG